MKKHVKIYLDAMGYDTSDFIPCEVCGAKAVDIHHIVPRSKMGEDTIENLSALCRNCHHEVHNGVNLSNDKIIAMHTRLCGERGVYLHNGKMERRDRV